MYINWHNLIQNNSTVAKWKERMQLLACRIWQADFSEIFLKHYCQANLDLEMNLGQRQVQIFCFERTCHYYATRLNTRLGVAVLVSQAKLSFEKVRIGILNRVLSENLGYMHNACRHRRTVANPGRKSTRNRWNLHILSNVIMSLLVRVYIQWGMMVRNVVKKVSCGDKSVNLAPKRHPQIQSLL